MFFEVHNVCFSYYKKPLCLKEVSLKIKKGEKVFVFATKDMGKTTLLQVFSGFDLNYFGKIVFNGSDLKDISDKNKNFSLILAEPVLINKTIRANFDYFCDVNNLKPLTDEQIERCLFEFGLKLKASDKVSKLSLFEKRLFMLSRTFLKSPNILFLDDLFENLSKQEKQKMLKVYQKIFEKSDLTIISTLGEDGYFSAKSLQKSKKMAYLCNSELKFIKSIDEFENDFNNLDALNFFDFYRQIKVELAFEMGEYKIVFDNDNIVLLPEGYEKQFDKLKMKNFDICDCVLVIKKDIGLTEDEIMRNLVPFLRNKEAKLFDELTGEKLI